MKAFFLVLFLYFVALNLSTAQGIFCDSCAKNFLISIGELTGRDSTPFARIGYNRLLYKDKNCQFFQIGPNSAHGLKYIYISIHDEIQLIDPHSFLDDFSFYINFINKSNMNKKDVVKLLSEIKDIYNYNSDPPNTNFYRKK